MNTEEEAYQYIPIPVVKIDVARASLISVVEFKRDGNWLILTLEKFQEWIKENLYYMEEGDSYIIQMDTMAKKDFEDLPEHTGW